MGLRHKIWKFTYYLVYLPLIIIQVVLIAPLTFIVYVILGKEYDQLSFFGMNILNKIKSKAYSN